MGLPDVVGLGGIQIGEDEPEDVRVPADRMAVDTFFNVLKDAEMLVDEMLHWEEGHFGVGLGG